MVKEVKEVGFCEKEKKIQIGERECFYQEFFDDKGEYERVRFYDCDGEFVTEFPDVRKMKEFLYRKEPDKVCSEIDTIKKFREKCKGLDWSWKGLKGFVGEEEKKINRETLVDRIGILMGDMNSYQFGAVVGLNPGTVYNIAHGTRGVGVHILKRISEECGVTVDWLLGG